MQVLLGVATLFFCCCIWLLVLVMVGYNPLVPAFVFPSLGWSNTLFFFFSTNFGINPGQPAGKGREKKNPSINHGQLVGKRRKIKKNPGINPGQPAGKGRKNKNKIPGINLGQTAEPRFQDLILSVCRGPVRLSRFGPFVEIMKSRSTPERTHKQTAKLI